MQQISHKLKVRLRAAFPHCFRTFLLPAFVFPAGGGGVPAASTRKNWGSWGAGRMSGLGSSRERNPSSGHHLREPAVPPRPQEGLAPARKGETATVSRRRIGTCRGALAVLPGLGDSRLQVHRGPLPSPLCPGLTPGPHLTIHFMPLSGLCRHPNCKSSNTEGTCPPVLSLLGHLTGAPATKEI